LEQYEEALPEELPEEDFLRKENQNDREHKSEEFEPVKNAILQMTAFNIYQLYSDLFRNIEQFAYGIDKQEMEDLRFIGIYTIRQLEQCIVNYEDAAPIIFLKTALDTVNNTKSIKHVIIDEAQDYTAVQYEIIKKAFVHCKMTILGDLNQSINAYMNVGSFDIISDIFQSKDTTSISLTKSYRSSKEIADFCNELLTEQNATEHLNRHGSKPRLIKTDRRNHCRRLAEDIASFKKQGYKLIAVICKTAGESEAMYKSIKSYVDIDLISNQNEVYQGGVVLIPSYLAKGLEFDAVLVNSVDAAEYSKEEERRLLYTVCTRALHELYLYYYDNLSGFIKKMDGDCYSDSVLAT
jgi:Superfamily I DNA and RNA helicases